MNKKKWITVEDVTVLVESDNSYVFELLHEELGDYFSIGDGQPDNTELLGHIIVNTTMPTHCDLARKEPVERIVLHTGSAPGDHRTGLVYDAKDGKVVLSEMTGSFIEVNDHFRLATIYNTDGHRGAQDARRIVRNQLVLKALESKGGVLVHGAAFAKPDGSGVLVAAGSGGGKTTMFLTAMNTSTEYRMLSCERVILLPTNGQLKLIASPESIRLFPGTIKQFRNLRSLVSTHSADNDWSKAHKVRISWRQLLAQFNAQPAVDPVYLNHIYFPSFSFDDATAENAEPCANLKVHTLTGSDFNRPNWLGWYVVDCESSWSQVSWILKDISSQCIRWRTPSDLELLLKL